MKLANRIVAFAILLGLAGIPAIAQDQTPAKSSAGQGSSLGDYARQIRKEPDGKTKGRVFDNDNLPKEDKLSVVGKPRENTETPAEQKPEEAAAPAAGTENKPQTPAAGADTSKTDEAAKQAAWKQWGDKLASQQETIDLLTRELDVLQREYQIRAAAMYADAGNRLRNSGNWDQQDAQYKQQIADKQKALDDAKQKLEDMREDARKAGVPSSVREP